MVLVLHCLEFSLFPTWSSLLQKIGSSGMLWASRVTTHPATLFQRDLELGASSAPSCSRAQSPTHFIW